VRGRALHLTLRTCKKPFVIELEYPFERIFVHPPTSFDTFTHYILSLCSIQSLPPLDIYPFEQRIEYTMSRRDGPWGYNQILHAFVVICFALLLPPERRGLAGLPQGILSRAARKDGGRRRAKDTNRREKGQARKLLSPQPPLCWTRSRNQNQTTNPCLTLFCHPAPPPGNPSQRLQVQLARRDVDLHTGHP
jgi:hypothetical protein